MKISVFELQKSLIRKIELNLNKGELEFISATIGDVEEIFNLIHHYYKKKIVLARSREDIIHHLADFTVARDKASSKVIGCSSFHFYNTELVEIRSLCVDSNYLRLRVGEGLVSWQLEKAKSLAFKNLFTLTIAVEFFEKLGFLRITKEQLPAKIFKDCMFCEQQKTCFEQALIYSFESAS